MDRGALRKRLRPEAIRTTRANHLAGKSKLKTDVKSTTAVVNRVASLDDSSVDNLVDDVENKLFLRRYTEEIALAIVRAETLKLRDVPAIVRLAAAMHERYDDFLNHLVEALIEAFKETLTGGGIDAKAILRRRFVVRLTSELVTCGFLLENDYMDVDDEDDIEYDDGIVHSDVVVKMFKKSAGLAKMDASAPLSNASVASLPVFVSVLKSTSVDLLGREKRSAKNDVGERAVDDEVEAAPAVPRKMRARLVRIVTTYARCGVVRLLMERESLRDFDEKLENDKALRGANAPMLDKRKAASVARHSAFDKLRVGLDSLVDCLGVEAAEHFEELPSTVVAKLYEEEKETAQVETEKKGLELYKNRTNASEDDDPRKWVFGSEDVRAFYQDLPDLEGILPHGVLAHGEGVLPAVKDRVERRRRERLGASSSGASPDEGGPPAGGGNDDEDAEGGRRDGAEIFDPNAVHKTKGSIGMALTQLSGKMGKKVDPVAKQVNVVKRKQKTIDPKDLTVDGVKQRSNRGAGAKTVLVSKKTRDDAIETAAASESAEAPKEEPVDVDDPFSDEAVRARKGNDGPAKKKRVTVADTDAEERPLPLAVTELFSTLPDVLSAKKADAFSMDFAAIQSDHARRALAKELFDLSRRRSELCPYFARIVAVLSRLFRDFSSEVSRHLDGEFRWLQKRLNKTNISPSLRTRNVRFFGELAKFHLARSLRVGEDVEDECEIGVSKERVFARMDVLLGAFTNSNIEVLCSLLETCGRELYRAPKSHERMKGVLVALVRQKKAKYLFAADSAAVDNAYYYVKPPESSTVGSSARVPKVRSNEELYLRKVILKKLDKSHLQVTKLHLQRDEDFTRAYFAIRKLEALEDSEATIARCVAASTKTHAHFHFLSLWVKRLAPATRARVVAALVRSIDDGLAKPDFRKQRRRLNEINFFVALYGAGVCSFQNVVDLAYSILHRDHYDATLAREIYDARVGEMNTPEEKRRFVLRLRHRSKGPRFGGCRENDAGEFHPGEPATADPSVDCFRIRMMSALLGSLASYVFPILEFDRRIALGQFRRLRTKPPARFRLAEDVVANKTRSIARLLYYVDRYVMCKTFVPVDVEFDLNEALEMLEYARSRQTALDGGDSSEFSINFVKDRITSNPGLLDRIIETLETENPILPDASKSPETFSIDDGPTSAPAVDDDDDDDELMDDIELMEDVDDDDNDDDDDGDGPNQEARLSSSDNDEDDEDEDDEDEDDGGSSDGSSDSSSSDSEEEDDSENGDSEDEEEREAQMNDGEDDESSSSSVSSSSSADDDAFAQPAIVTKSRDDHIMERELEAVLKESLSLTARGSSSVQAQQRREKNVDSMTVPRHLLAKSGGATSAPASTVRFQLLKKTNKGKIKVLGVDLSEDSAAARAARKDREADEADKALLKSLVLDYAANPLTDS